MIEGCPEKLLHIYGQEGWHDTVHIVGTSDALRLLVKAIERAIKQQVSQTDSNCYVNDGEGFDVRIVRIDDKRTAESIAVPYTLDYAREKSVGAIRPWKLLEGRIGQRELKGE